MVWHNSLESNSYVIVACKSDWFDTWLLKNLQIFINQYSSAELQTPGISVYSFARDYLCLQFWSFCFFPRLSPWVELWRHQNLALGLKYLFEHCPYLLMDLKYKERSLVLFVQPFQARVFSWWLLLIRNRHHHQSSYFSFSSGAWHETEDSSCKSW